MSDVPSTTPKPFVFVLMPIEPAFDDIYKFGIKGAAEDVGAYAERLDEQLFVEGMLDRIFNQISKADVIVADMTGRNPNVFYEVGYAHALGKITLLLTQDAADIPFDLKHRQHIVYGGSIEILRKQLSERLRWGIAESRRQSRGPATERVSIRLLGVDIPRSGATKDVPTVGGKTQARAFQAVLHVRSESFDPIPGITHVYLFTEENSGVVPIRYESVDMLSFGAFPLPPYTPATRPVRLDAFEASAADAPDGLVDEFRLGVVFGPIPPGAVETAPIELMLKDEVNSCDVRCRLRLHTPTQFHDFSFRLVVQYEKVESPEPSGDSAQQKK